MINFRRAGMLLPVLLLTIPLSGADLFVPQLELLTRGVWDDANSTVILSNEGNASIDISGGYKFGGSLSIGFESSNLGNADLTAGDVITETVPATADSNSSNISALAAYLDDTTYLKFIGAEIEYRELFGQADTSLAWFIGETDSFCSGDIFPLQFATATVATRYRGKRYFSSGFDGIHRVNGTGLKVDTGWGSEVNRTSFYLYQDGYVGQDSTSNIKQGVFSFDGRTAFNFESLKIEAFAGASFPTAAAGLYRAGLLFHYNPGSAGEFLAEIGVPRWAAPDPFSIGDFFFLFEPRIHIDPLTVILTLFWQPNYYLQTQTEEGESADIHINFLFGDSPDSRVSGGVETSFIVNTDYASSADNQFEIVTTPYLSLSTPGVAWNFALDVNLLPFDLASMFTGIISIKAVF